MTLIMIFCKFYLCQPLGIVGFVAPCEFPIELHCKKHWLECLRKCIHYDTVGGGIVVDSCFSGSGAVSHDCSCLASLDNIAISIPGWQMSHSHIPFQVNQIFLLSAAPATDTAIMSEAKGVR